MSRNRAERGAEKLIDAVGAVLATPAGQARIDCLARRIAGTPGGLEWCGACAAAPECETARRAAAAVALSALRESLTCATEHADFLAELVMPAPPQ